MTNSLDLTLILSAAGTFAAIFIPLIILLLRRQTGPQLDIVLDKEVFLVNQLARDLKNFSISIDGEPATEQVAWITGWIINSGTLDISARMVENPLRLELLETMSWIRVDIDHSSSGVDCKCAVIDGRMAEFDWALLRSGEYVYFDSLIECPLAETREKWAGSSFAEMIQPNSRIENIRTDAIVPISHLGDKYNRLCCKLGEGAMRDQGASCSPYDSALARRSCSHAMASVRAHGPRPKARSTIRASPTMPPWRANIPAWPLRSARITSKPLIVA